MASNILSSSDIPSNIAVTSDMPSSAGEYAPGPSNIPASSVRNAKRKKAAEDTKETLEMRASLSQYSKIFELTI
jgi:hypothetical protein